MYSHISNFPIFTDISKDEIDNLLPSIRHRSFKKNHTLMFENDMCDHVYFISTGMLKVFRMHEGQEIILGIITAGDMIGEVEILSDDDYLISSIEVLEDTDAWVIPKQDFLTLLNHYPSIYKYAYDILAERLRVLNRLIRYLAFYDVRRKIANLLLDLYYNFGKDGVIDIKLNQTMLANMLSISRESMSTTLANLRDEEIIDIRDKSFYILNEKKLELISDEAEEIAIRRKWRST